MGIKAYKPTTSGHRFMTGFDFSEITKKTPEKRLLEKLSKNGGRNNTGRLTMRHKGGGHKRHYRLVDFKRQNERPAVVQAIEYDPNRTCRIALICYENGEKSYILAPLGLKVGDAVFSGKMADIKPGHCKKLKDIPVGTEIHNIELVPLKGGQVVRGAGAVALLVSKLGKYCHVKMPSGEVRLILSECRASIGQVGNTEHENLTYGKAGRSRWRGIRPTVRGMCMNPVDHPMGGGEGRSKGHHPRTPWGKPCKGHRTRNNKRTNSMIVKRRTKKKEK